MDVVLGILGLLVLIGIFWAFSWLRDRTVAGINRTVHGKAHREGDRLAREHISITAPPMPTKNVLDAIVAELNVFDGAPVVGHKAYLKDRNDSGVVVSFGNKLFTAWAIGILVNDDAEDGVKVFTTTLQATEVDGVMPGARELGLVHERVRSAVTKLRKQAASGAA